MLAAISLLLGLHTTANAQSTTVHSTLSDATGNYTLANLPVGPYRLEVKTPGFKDHIQSGIELVVNNNIQINVTMQIGAATERVEVSATASMVETKENSISNPATGLAYGSVNTMDDGAVAHYQGLLTSVQHRFANNFTFPANFTDSYCISDADFGAALAGASNSQPFNRHADWGPCVFDTRSNFNVSLVANGPWKSGSAWMKRLLSDWQLAPLLHASSGQPLNVTVGKDNSLTGLGNDRPNQALSDTRATNAICSNGSTPCVQWLNPAAFLANPPGTFGDPGRNAVRGPGTTNFDVALSRQFKFKERYSPQVRADAFNIMNHPNFVGAISPAGTVTGYSTLSTGMTSSSFGRVAATFDPRILQFSMKFYY